MGFKKDAEELGEEIIDTIEKKATPYKTYIVIIFMLMIAFFLYKKFGAQLLNKPKKYF